MRLLLIFGGILIIILLLITSIAPFRNSLLSGIFPKDASHAAGSGSLSLLPNVNGSVGQTISTPLMLDTGGQNILGVDAILNFDKTALEFTDYTLYPQNSSLSDFLPVAIVTNKAQFIASANSNGIISISSIAPTNNSFNGVLDSTRPLALLEFKILNANPTSVTFYYVPGSTIDSNLVSTAGTEVLSVVTNMNVNGPAQSPPITYPESSIPQKIGDIDKNGTVDIFDYNQLLTDFGKIQTGLTSDLDNNGRVDIFDYNLLLTNFGI